jgi:hypothetical protein
MSRQGPPKHFFDRPKPPEKIPVPKPKPIRPGGGASGKSRRPVAPASTSRWKFWKGGEDWKTYVVVGVSAIILVGFAISFIRQSNRQLDMSRAVSEMALIAATLKTLDDAPDGFRPVESLRRDDVLLAFLRDVAGGGKVQRNDQGEITGSIAPERGDTPLFRTPIPPRCVLGEPFQFDFLVVDAKNRIPAIVVQSVGRLSHPDEKGRWTFEGDLTHVPRDLVLGGEELAVTVKRGDGSNYIVNLFKPVTSSSEPSGS